MPIREEGAYKVYDSFSLLGGLNTADSPFIVAETQATDGYNWDYTTRGAITKRLGHAAVLAVPDSQASTLGLGLYDAPGASRAVLRAAGTRLQNLPKLGTSNVGPLAALYTDSSVSNVGTCTITIANPGVVTFNIHGLQINDPVQFTTTGALPTGLVASTTYYVQSPSTNTFQVSSTINGPSIVTSGTQSGTQTLKKFSTTVFSTSQPATFAMGCTSQSNVLWCAGGGVSNLYGAYSSTQWTPNGVPSAPVTQISNFTTAVTTTGGNLSKGFYAYSISLVKASTGAEGNVLSAVYEDGAQADCNAGGTSTNQVLVSWTLTSADTTRYTHVNVYRSQVNTSSGTASGFTAGVYIGQVPIATTSIIDYGYSATTGLAWVNASSGAANANYVDSSASVPRAGNLELDQSPLPSGTYNSVVVWNGRLVTASGSTVYISDTEKFEAWPLSNTFNVPSGGSITGLGVCGLSSGVAGVGINEALVIFKEREMWTLVSTGAPFDYTTWQFSFMGTAGCPSQRLCVNTDSGLLWMNYRGVFMWNGAGKPLYLSQPIEDKFAVGGDLNASSLSFGWGQFFQQKKQVVWCVPSNLYGVNQYCIKLDLRLTMMQTNGLLTQAVTHGIFSPDETRLAALPLNAGLCFTAASNSASEIMYLGDTSGYVYSGYTATYDTTPKDGTPSPIPLSYTTPYLTMGSPTVRKHFSKVVAWVQNTGETSLSLNYWSNWATLSSAASLAVGTLPGSKTSVPGVWDTSTWGGPNVTSSAAWVGGAVPSLVPVVFNLNAQTNNNNDGTCLRLAFVESGSTYTPVIYGYSVYYTEMGAS